METISFQFDPHIYTSRPPNDKKRPGVIWIEYERNLQDIIGFRIFHPSCHVPPGSLYDDWDAGRWSAHDYNIVTGTFKLDIPIGQEYEDIWGDKYRRENPCLPHELPDWMKPLADYLLDEGYLPHPIQNSKQ